LTPPDFPASRRTPLPPSGNGASWGIAEEVPVEIGFNGKAWTVMMASPTDLEDLAVGLALTEGIIQSGSDIERIDIRPFPEGITADIRLPASKLKTERLQKRALDGRTGCGLCGVETLADLHRPATNQTRHTEISEPAIKAAFDALPEHQPLNSETRTVHAAAWCDPEGHILLVREDIGRHNALDKLAGARLRDGECEEAGFVILSSRCSYELVFKAARLHASLLASLSAPTGMALDLARSLSLGLATRGPNGQIIQFSGEEKDG